MTITTELSEIVPERIDYLQLKKDTNFIPVINHFMCSTGTKFFLVILISYSWQ